MGASPERIDQRREARDAWCAEQKLGSHTAVFYPGDELRCPATKNRGDGRKGPCGASLNLWAKPRNQVVIRTKTFRDPPGPIGMDGRCHSCHAQLEIFALLEATG